MIREQTATLAACKGVAGWQGLRASGHAEQIVDCSGHFIGSDFHETMSTPERKRERTAEVLFWSSRRRSVLPGMKSDDLYYLHSEN